MDNGTPTPTTQRTLRQMVQEADPEFQKESRRPVIYSFSNGREFRQKPDPYSTP
jgi:hypothetical protein